MQNVLPLNSCNDEDQFSRISSFRLNETEQSTLIRLAIEVLELRHRPGECFDNPQAIRDYL